MKAFKYKRRATTGSLAETHGFSTVIEEYYVPELDVHINCGGVWRFDIPHEKLTEIQGEQEEVEWPEGDEFTRMLRRLVVCIIDVKDMEPKALKALNLIDGDEEDEDDDRDGRNQGE